MTRPLTESELRRAVRLQLLERVVPGEIHLFEELQIERGAARVDLALIGQQLEAFELKSDLDNFARLHNQIHAYNRVFDRITIVTGSVHAQVIQEIVPSWWGVMAAECVVDTVRIDEPRTLEIRGIRLAKANPDQDRRSLARLLWREAAAAVLREESSVPVPRKANRYDLELAIAGSVDLCRLRERVCRHLLERNSVKATKPSRSSGGSLHHDASYLGFHCLT